jgi:catechol 2,3-dioxygenase-like lactoylglutathione lyase family enzyme
MPAQNAIVHQTLVLVSRRLGDLRQRVIVWHGRRQQERRVNILFISSVAVISPNPAESRKLFIDTLGLPLERHEGDDYYFSEKVKGAKHFGVWPLSQAAEACFGTPTWPADRPVPQSCIEFEVADIESVTAAALELAAKGYVPLHDARTEPWGQTVARVQTAEGVIVGISYAPWMHEAVAPGD